MNPYLGAHLTDGALRRGLVAAVPKSLQAYATSIAHIAEFDSRRLYPPEGYPSMCAFLVGELELSEQVAKKLIRVGRTALQFPEIFVALADGRLNASGVILLAPWLTRENARELLAVAARRSNDEIRELLADRAPKLDVPVSLTPLPGSAEVSVRTPEDCSAAVGDGGNSSMVSVRTPQRSERPRLSPLGAGRCETRFTIEPAAREAIRCFEQLAGRQVTSQEMSEALAEGFQRAVGRTTSTRPSARSARASCTRSASERGERRIEEAGRPQRLSPRPLHRRSRRNGRRRWQSRPGNRR